ncbi:MAG TPA: VOC family protein [Microthrixaceae bacterium]|nr:VOC family protein [Microthrixaceae bacterium]
MEVSSHAAGTPSWIDLGTPDVEAAKSFYGGLFGWAAETDPRPGGGGCRWCGWGGRAVAGLGPKVTPGPPLWTTYITVDSLDATLAAVVEAGGTIVMPAMDVMDAGRMAIFQDPAGAFCSLWQPLGHIGAELVNEAGTLCWNELSVRDADAAIAFYTSVFGWTAATNVVSSEGMTYTEFSLGDRSVGGLMRMDDTWPAEVPPHWMVYFAVDDCDAAATTVAELGGEVCVAPTDIAPGRFAVVADPQGATFSVLALSPEMTQMQG